MNIKLIERSNTVTVVTLDSNKFEHYVCTLNNCKIVECSTSPRYYFIQSLHGDNTITCFEKEGTEIERF